MIHLTLWRIYLYEKRDSTTPLSPQGNYPLALRIVAPLSRSSRWRSRYLMGPTIPVLPPGRRLPPLLPCSTSNVGPLFRIPFRHPLELRWEGGWISGMHPTSSSDSIAGSALGPHLWCGGEVSTSPQPATSDTMWRCDQRRSTGWCVSAGACVSEDGSDQGRRCMGEWNVPSGIGG